MLFMGMANAYVMRTNMSVAIVAMVNHTALDKAVEVNTTECPDADYGEEVSTKLNFNIFIARIFL